MAEAADETIRTERLILRPHRAEDVEAYAPLWAPPNAAVHTPLLDAEGAWARLLRLIGHRAVFGFAPFLVEETATGRLVGEVGFARFRRGLGPDFDEAPEAMWILASETRGRGYATEAMTAALAGLAGRDVGRRTVCMIDPANGISLRLAARLGFVEFDRRARNGRDIMLFERGEGGRVAP